MRLPVCAMVSQSASIIPLCQCFRGLPPKRLDWLSLIGLANRTLTTPALMDFVDRFPGRVPQDARRYVTEIFRRNVIRNDRLAAQLMEAVAALNDKGVTPVLLKGTALLASKDRAYSKARLISDLDLLVPPHQVNVALDCLFALGYCVHFQSSPGAAKWYADLQRPEDVGMIDLHQALPGHPFFYRSFGDLRQSYKLTPVGQGSAYIPSATCQALMLIIHDQFQDSDYWVGAIDLRHLLDLRDLINSPEGLDWKMLASLTSSSLVRNALETQLVTLHYLLGVDVPVEMRSRLIARLQYWRRLLQTRMPLLGRPLLIMGLLDYWSYRAELGREERIANHLEASAWVLPKMDTMRFLFDLTREHRGGKV